MLFLIGKPVLCLCSVHLHIPPPLSITQETWPSCKQASAAAEDKARGAGRGGEDVDVFVVLQAQGLAVQQASAWRHAFRPS